MEWAAKRRFPYLMVFTPIERIAQMYGEYREACERNGYTASRYQLTVNLPIVVAENDAKADGSRGKHVLWVYNMGLRMQPPFWQPPGYIDGGLAAPPARTRPRSRPSSPSRSSDEGGYIICGSPATVRDKLRVFSDELKAGIVCSG